MNDNRTGGWLLVAGSLAGLITMGLHPVAPHPGAPSPHALGQLILLNRAIHGLGIASMPILFLGALALTRRLTGTNRLPLAALVFYGFAGVAIMVAGSMSGFVASDLMEKLTAIDPLQDTRRLFFDYTFRLNQAFASVYLVGSCVAIFLWSAAMVRTRQLSSGLGVYGLVLASGMVAALFSGMLRPDVHGFGLVVVMQSIWFIVAGMVLMRADEAGRHAEEIAFPGTTG